VHLDVIRTLNKKKYTYIHMLYTTRIWVLAWVKIFVAWVSSVHATNIGISDTVKLVTWVHMQLLLMQQV
jgi:hypothetical protein